MRPRKLQPEQIAALIAQGLSTREMAEQTGIKRGTIQHAIKRYGLPRPPRKMPLRVAPWCPPEHWPTYMALTTQRLTMAERRAIVEMDIARERGK